MQDGTVLDAICPYGFSQSILDLYSGSVLLKQKKHRRRWAMLESSPHAEHV